MATERRYWDTACFLAILGREPGRFEACEAILRAAVMRNVEIVTSAFTITEVLYPKGGKPLSAEVRAKVKRFFRHPGIVLVNVDRSVAESAQEYFWISTCVRMRCTSLPPWRPTCPFSRRTTSG